ncbi:MarR family winged helix-turn-helix transcriptional regulator [Leekyejoonella antrihumi]|uniref:MarR family transcriptional regulator n=1 Tax=Leekyejoonella antrihumi TaxID=1660198 RepID=A0A563E946_9MICO|nr:MarR family transcriptional regulator [Leekyejoonella antrihumi]TWP39040.1 MarR family transcriptional regulator [Leekyejoonella antrihumi]
MTGETAPVAARDEADPVAVIEVQAAVLTRNFELLRRRSGFDSQLDRAGYLLLLALDSLGPSDIGTLAAALGLDPSTVGRQVAAAEGKGLVTRNPDPQDRRRSVVTASPDGLARMAELSVARQRRTTKMLAGWSVEDLAQLARMFTRYNEEVAHHYFTGIDQVGCAAPHDQPKHSTAEDDS